MKASKWMAMMAAFAIGGLMFTACDDDDNDALLQVPSAVTTAFAEQYGATTRVDWDVENAGAYFVAEFYDGGLEHEAWYTANGTWVMTEVDYGRNTQLLPQAVQNGYANTAYATGGWSIDDIDEIRRPGYDAVYIIEIEKAGQQDRMLYFDLNGTLIRDMADIDGNGSHYDMINAGIPQAIQDFIDAHYAGAVIVDFDVEANGYEVDIRHGGQSKELEFDLDYVWLSTSTDCTMSIPALVTEAVQANYPGKRIEDCDYIETASGQSYYLVDLDDTDYDLVVTVDGMVTAVPD